MPPDSPSTPKLDPVTLKVLRDAFNQLDKYPLIRREEGDFWAEDPEDSSVMCLCRNSGVVFLWMPKEDYEAMRTFGGRYKEFQGAAEGLPKDLASQHEHYRLGTPKSLPTYEEDKRVFVIVGGDKSFDWVWKLTTMIQKEIFGPSDWINHIDDVMPINGHFSRIAILKSAWDGLPAEQQTRILAWVEMDPEDLSTDG